MVDFRFFVAEGLPNKPGGKLRRASNREQAQEHLTTAKAMYREMDMTHGVGQAEAELRQLG